ncbi:hypothetical protein [Shewanella sp. 10N.286.52.B9]|uniref:hypothetical protein n=1 Tax=Shewanella sp. 10N.286.52.B9 TaxID=1880837 RepID=UPI001054B6B7|nr:hypothetical protein [Shewanella sp. 10N.286.52.B9]
MKQVISSVVMQISVDYLFFNKQRLPYIIRRDTCLQSMFVVHTGLTVCHPNAVGDCATADA